MTNEIIKNIKNIKKSFERKNFSFSKTRINQNGKKTNGWKLKIYDNKNKIVFEDKDFNHLENKKLLFEN